MRNMIRATAAAGAIGLTLAALTACAAPSGGGAGEGDVTLTYWATNQASDIPADEEILRPVLDEFTESTGIKVDLQVLPWSEINNKLLAATASGRGPDVTNFGNTNAWTYGSTGALLELGAAELKAIGGTDRFIPAVLETSGPSPITSIPLYSQAYGLFYNKALFAEANLEAPTTWEELTEAADALTDAGAGQYGMTLQGASPSQNMQFTYIFARQNGGSPFDVDDNPTFTNDATVDAAKRYLDLMTEGYVNPADAQIGTSPEMLSAFTNGKAAMVMSQNGIIPTLTSMGMSSDEYGVVPIPSPKGGEDIASIVAGTNIAIFKNTKHKEAALDLVKFMTSSETIATLDEAYQLLPTLSDAGTDFLDDKELAETFSSILQERSVPFPPTAPNTAYLTTVGGAVQTMFGQIATGTKITVDDVRAALSAAQDQMPKN